MISALRLVSRAADGFQVEAVVGATGDAAHQAVGVQGVALRVAARGRQGGDVGAGPGARRPGHVSHSLGDLGHVDGRGAARTSGMEMEITQVCTVVEDQGSEKVLFFMIDITCFQWFTESR